MTTNILGDYFYQTDQKLSASILYENSWDRYRNNPKAKNLTAQLLFELKQPTLAKEQLEESFAEAPQVDNIMLLCERLQRENKFFEAVYYLENGLKRFPNNPYLTQNLALLYTLVQRQEEAILLLKDSPKDSPSAVSNWLALQVKFGLTPEFTSSPSDLVGLINQVAARRKSGIPVPEEELSQLKARLLKETSAQLIQAGYRNLLSSPNSTDPSADLALMDSLSKEENFLDYSMQLQETAILRSLGAGRIGEAVKNLNGLAFRNPGDAAYYLNLTGLIQAQQLDFEKAAKDFAFSKAKGFSAQKEIHLTTLAWATDSVAQPTAGSSDSPQEILTAWGKFNEQLPQALFSQWKTLPAGPLKTSLASKLLSHKGHDLSADQFKELGVALSGKVTREQDLTAFISQPNWSNTNALRSITQFLGVPDVLNANPYFTPLIISAAAQAKDPLAAYELLNSASQFNKDPLLWIKKIQAAKALGLDNYANAAQEELGQWLSQVEIEKLLGANN
jgi:tetratricopeptide (TPR) repeat protein